MRSSEIRRKFIEFFKEKEHGYVKSSPIVVKNDPTLMFTNAGMNQFKDIFLGNQSGKFSRVANSQKCLRVSGKHNDLEEVGKDTYHHTMFEMLGNWSFGDYFKEEAISWAWELLTEVYQLPKDRLYASVFGGDKGDNMPVDVEAEDLWKGIIDEDRIIYGSKADNFWEMGETGPCGPCSEIHIDLRSEAEIAETPGRDLVNMDHPQVVEIWNLVFIQFNRLSNGSLEKLPAQHVDTGMGFERLAMAIQQSTSNYDTDVFTPLIKVVESLSGKTYGKDEEIDIAIRVVVDHIRAIAFAIADGQLPSNNKAGYVIRRILRRAVRYGHTFLGIKEPFLHKLVPILSEQFKDFFTELVEQQSFIEKAIKEEELSFLRTLDTGLKKLDQIIIDLPTGNKVIPGEQVFELYDTFGFPKDLTSLIAGERSVEIDEAGFVTEMNRQKDRSRNAVQQVAGDWVQVLEDASSTFVGYDNLTTESKVVKYREIAQKKQKIYQVVLDQTPFYAESGGQVGDQGTLTSANETIKVIDTVKENDLTIHLVNKLPESSNATFVSKVNGERRFNTQLNHSATHLMHEALRQVLGTHVQQKGSLVNDKGLRFDFSHFSKMTADEIEAVETIVNQKIRENISLEEMRNVPIDEAKAMGATALFGEKYGDHVRVIIFDKDYSVELCGGCHAQATGNIGMFKIMAESSVATGVRRIEAITGVQTEDLLQSQTQLIGELKQTLKSPDLLKGVTDLVAERNQLLKEIEALNNEKAQGLKAELLTKGKSIGGINVLIQQIDISDANALKNLAFELKNELNPLFGILAANIKGKPQIAMVISEDLVKDKSLNAGNLVRDLAKNIQGGGGGQPFFATAGGKKIEGLKDVVFQGQELANKLFS